MRDFRDEITARYDAPMYRAMLEVYGDQIHPGIFEHGDESLHTASMRATRRLARMAGLKEGDNVLETACGVGGTARFLARTYGCSITATNISREQITIAQEWSRASDTIIWEFADFEDLPYDDGSFLFYWCQDSLIFSPDREKAIAEAARVLEPGGIAVISDLTVLGDPDDRTRGLLGEISEPGLWSPRHYRDALDSAGFSVFAEEDWSAHVLGSFRRIRAEITARKEKLAEIASLEDVENTMSRYALWCETAETGHLGWTALTARKTGAGDEQ